jgi:hypothetical protein
VLWSVSAFWILFPSLPEGSAKNFMIRRALTNSDP